MPFHLQIICDQCYYNDMDYRPNWEMIAALTGVILGIGSLAISFWQTRSQVQLHEYSSRPVVIFDQAFTAEQHYIQRIINVGNGPARLKWFTVWANGQKLQTWDDLFTFLDVTDDLNFYYTLVPSDHVLSSSYPNNTQLLFETQTPKIAEGIWSHRETIQIQFCYCDLLTRKCWVENVNAQRSEPNNYKRKCAFDIAYPPDIQE